MINKGGDLRFSNGRSLSPRRENQDAKRLIAIANSSGKQQLSSQNIVDRRVFYHPIKQSNQQKKHQSSEQVHDNNLNNNSSGTDEDKVTILIKKSFKATISHFSSNLAREMQKAYPCQITLEESHQSEIQEEEQQHQESCKDSRQYCVQLVNKLLQLLGRELHPLSNVFQILDKYVQASQYCYSTNSLKLYDNIISQIQSQYDLINSSNNQSDKQYELFVQFRKKERIRKLQEEQQRHVLNIDIAETFSNYLFTKCRDTIVAENRKKDRLFDNFQHLDKSRGMPLNNRKNNLLVAHRDSEEIIKNKYSFLFTYDSNNNNSNNNKSSPNVAKTTGRTGSIFGKKGSMENCSMLTKKSLIVPTSISTDSLNQLSPSNNNCISPQNAAINEEEEIEGTQEGDEEDEYNQQTSSLLQQQQQQLQQQEEDLEQSKKQMNKSQQLLTSSKEIKKSIIQKNISGNKQQNQLSIIFSNQNANSNKNNNTSNNEQFSEEKDLLVIKDILSQNFEALSKETDREEKEREDRELEQKLQRGMISDQLVKESENSSRALTDHIWQLVEIIKQRFYLDKNNCDTSDNLDELTAYVKETFVIQIEELQEKQLHELKQKYSYQIDILHKKCKQLKTSLLQSQRIQQYLFVSKQELYNFLKVLRQQIDNLREKSLQLDIDKQALLLAVKDILLNISQNNNISHSYQKYKQYIQPHNQQSS